MEANQNERRLTIKEILILLSIFLAIGLVAYFVGKRDGKISLSKEIKTQVDTMLVRDTIVSYKPVYVEKIKTERVPVVVEKTDTMMLHDTLYVYLQKEQITWEDSLSKVWVSGVMPEVDSVQHYITERIVTKEVVIPKVKKTRWGLGIHAGYGLQFGQQIQACPYVGVGVSYDLLSW
jgi:hypothetical protein